MQSLTPVKGIHLPAGVCLLLRADPERDLVRLTWRMGHPHEKPVGGKKSDLAVTVVHSPTLNEPRVHDRAGVSALCIHLTVVHPCTGKDILVPNALVDAGKAKIAKHDWHEGRGYGFVPFVCSTMGDVSNDAYGVLSLLSKLRAEAQDSVLLY